MKADPSSFQIFSFFCIVLNIVVLGGTVKKAHITVMSV